MVTGRPVVQEALVWASLAEGKFGLYDYEHKGQEGSDIDLVTIIDEKHEIPENWKFTTVKKVVSIYIGLVNLNTKVIYTLLMVCWFFHQDIDYKKFVICLPIEVKVFM